MFMVIYTEILGTWSLANLEAVNGLFINYNNQFIIIHM